MQAWDTFGYRYHEDAYLHQEERKKPHQNYDRNLWYKVAAVNM